MCAALLCAQRTHAPGADRVQDIGSGGQDSGRRFGMPVELAPLRPWYDQGRLAWLR